MRLITVFYWMLKFLKYLGFFDDEKKHTPFLYFRGNSLRGGHVFLRVMFYFYVPRDSPFHM